MKALARRLHALEEAEVLDLPWASLGSMVHPRPGNLIVALGAPGVGKSTFALGWTKDLLDKDQPALYLSLDTPLHDQAARLCALLSHPQVEVQGVQNNLKEWVHWLGEKRLPLRFSDHQMEMEEVEELVEAEAQWFGEYPRLIVVDNMGDLLEGEASVESVGVLLAGLKNLAIRTDSVVLALHHIKRGQEAVMLGLEPPTMTSGLYGGERPAQIVLGLWRPVEGAMNVAILKNRMGRAAPDASLSVSLSINLATAQIWEGLHAIN